MKETSIAKKVQRIEHAMSQIENGKYCDVSPLWITNQISWLWRFRYIDKETMERLADKMTYLYNEGYCDSYMPY